MMKTTTFLKQAFLLGVVVCSSTLWGQTPYVMSLGDKTWDLSGTWSVSGNTYTGTDANNWKSVPVGGSGNEVTSGTRTTKSSGTIVTTTTGGFQKPSGTIQLLSTGSTSTPEAVAIDLLLDFTGRNAGTLSFDWAAIDNSNGTRPTSLKVFWSVDGTTFTELTAAQLLDKESATAPASGSITSITLPSAFNNVSTARIRFYNYAGSNAIGSGARDKMQIDNIAITSTAIPVTPTWDGTQWVGGTPSASTDAIINGDYSGASFTAANLTVNATRTLTITNGNTVTATNVTNNGSIVVENGGNFIQATGGTYTNNGNFTVNKNTTSAANKYVFWASPTVSQNMYGIHTTAPQYVMTYNSDTDYYNTLTNPATSTPGVGYSVKMPATNAIATFGGATAQPNNGNVVVTLNNTSTNKYNLIGNPYPSNLDLNAFYNANSSSVTSTFWFWDNTSNNVTTQTGNTTTNVGYATYNAAGAGTWTEAPSSLATHSGSSAAVGQGFIVEATGTTATFTNAMRVSTTGNTFNKLNGNDTGKFWLKLATPYGSHTTLAVNYESGAQNTFDKFDSRAMGIGSDAFYSTVGAEKLVIQGKSPFTIDDVIPLGNKHFEAGNFVISLTQKEGIFNNGQAIYLHDKELGTYTNLQNGNYSFSANAGEFTNRFEIVYKLGALATQEIEKTTFEVYRDGEDFVARNSKNIERIEIFDASGRKIVELKPNTSSAKFKLETKGMYILKALSAGKEYTQKLIK